MGMLLEEQALRLSCKDLGSTEEEAAIVGPDGKVDFGAGNRVSAEKWKEMESLLARLSLEKKPHQLCRVSVASVSVRSLRSGLWVGKATGKAVSFADIFGLELSKVKIFTDELPRIPRSAYSDLELDPSEYQVGTPLPPPALPRLPVRAPVPANTLMPMFNLPGSEAPAFLRRVHANKVCLENAFMTSRATVSGMVRVANLAFHKAVTVRWTVTDWSTVTEQPAWHLPGSSRDGTDQFQFRLELPPLPAGRRLEICLRLTAGGKDHWDSNGGDNYCFQVRGLADCGGHCNLNPPKHTWT
jgi:hypothetical protein